MSLRGDRLNPTIYAYRNGKYELLGGKNMGVIFADTSWINNDVPHPPPLFESPRPIRVVFNGPATIVIWSDGMKTVVKCRNEEFDYEKGFAMAIVKRYMKRADFKRMLDEGL